MYINTTQRRQQYQIHHTHMCNITCVYVEISCKTWLHRAHAVYMVCIYSDGIRIGTEIPLCNDERATDTFRWLMCMVWRRIDSTSNDMCEYIDSDRLNTYLW